MKNRVVNVISAIFLVVGLCVILYPEYKAKHSQRLNTELIDVVWNLMDEEYIDPELGLENEEDAKAYLEFEEAGNTMVIQEYASLQLEDETTKEGVKLSLEEKKNQMLQQNMVYGIIEFPSLEEYYAVVKGTSSNEMRIAIGHMNGTAHFGKTGNCVLAGHRGGFYGTFFQNIDQLKEGATVIVTNMRKQSFHYEVYEQFVVDSSDTEYIEPAGDEKILTLISSEEEGKKRLFVRCHLVEE